MKKIRSLFFGITLLLLPALSFAEETAGGEIESNVKAFLAVLSGLCIALAVIAGATAQGKVASTALDGIARNPGASGKMFVPMIIGLALIESLVIYALIISFMLQGKI